jgi:hypothetical protein
MPSNTEKLLGQLGFDPAKKPTLTDDILKEALKELEDTRKKETLEKARDLIRKAVELRQQAFRAEQDFNKQKKKFDDELGKLLNQLRVGVDQASQVVPDQPLEESVTE